MKSFSQEDGEWIIKCNVACLADIQVKELDKRASGQAFEVILSPTAPDAKGEFPLSTPKKKEVSLDEIQKKLDAAEERRKVRAALVMHCLRNVLSVLIHLPPHIRTTRQRS